MKKLRSFFTCCLLVLSANISATVITFDGPPVSFQEGYGDGDQYIESNYVFTSVSDPGHYGSLIRFNPFNQQFALPNNGTVHAGVSAFANVSFQRVDGAAFSLNSLDIGEYSEYSTNTTSVHILGHQSSGDVIQTSLGLDQLFDGYGGVSDFQNYILNWNDLVSVEFLSIGFSFDNIVVAEMPIVERKVPTPSSLALFITCLIPLMYRRRIINLA